MDLNLVYWMPQSCPPRPGSGTLSVDLRWPFTTRVVKEGLPGPAYDNKGLLCTLVLGGKCYYCPHLRLEESAQGHRALREGP